MRERIESHRSSGEYAEIAEYYDLFAENDDLEFYHKMAGWWGDPVLDLAAGTGRVAISLVQAGHSVTALEIEPAMRHVMTRKVSNLNEEEQSRIRIVEGDMTDFELGTKFSVIIIPASFGHAKTTEEQLSLLKCVRRHLSSEGVFILDLFPGGAMPEHSEFENGPVEMGDGRVVSRKGMVDCDYLTQTLTLQLVYTIKRNGVKNEIIRTRSQAAIIFNREADLLFRLAGLKIVEEYGAFDGRPYSPMDGRRIVLLQPG